MASNQNHSINSVAGALTFPSEGAGSSQAMSLQPRQPRNLQGLLRFAMEATKAEDAPGNSHFSPMDEERRRFLAEAMASITVDLTEVLKNSIEVLTNTIRMQSIQLGEPLPDEVEKAFTVLLDVVDDIDIANDFFKMGGFAMFPICYGSGNDQVRAYASRVLAEICQNNPFCQTKALEFGLVKILINLSQSERGDPLAKCVYAMSCCCRDFEAACRELISQGGCEILAHLLQAPESAVRTKAAFFVRYLCRHHNDTKERFIENNVIETIAAEINNCHDQATEHLLDVLLALLDGSDPSTIPQFTSSTIGLKTIIENHLRHPDLVDDSYYEEKEYCRELLAKLSPFHTQNEDSLEAADR